jgi:hypothetical protein
MLPKYFGRISKVRLGISAALFRRHGRGRLACDVEVDAAVQAPISFLGHRIRTPA